MSTGLSLNFIKRLPMIGLAMGLLLDEANAKIVHLQKQTAQDFITKYFPHAWVPGPVAGRFRYTDRSGRKKTGFAQCFVPAMGAASEGTVSRCEVKY